MAKVLVFDVETTGLDPVVHDVVSLAMGVSIGGNEPTEWKHIKMQPHSYENISQEALDVTGMTVEEMRTWQPPHEALYRIEAFFGSYINKYSKTDKLYPMGYNVGFDLEFLDKFFRKCNNTYFGSWQNWRKIDVYSMVAQQAILDDKFVPPEWKLAPVCKFYGLEEFDAHDALEDIKATWKLYKKLRTYQTL
jgi:DNA polymerase III epsilon subunit-like protein